MHDVFKILVLFTDKDKDLVLLSRVQNQTYLFSSVLIVSMKDEDIAKHRCTNLTLYNCRLLLKTQICYMFNFWVYFYLETKNGLKYYYSHLV